jgi:hypothetical protein
MDYFTKWPKVCITDSSRHPFLLWGPAGTKYRSNQGRTSSYDSYRCYSARNLQDPHHPSASTIVQHGGTLREEYGELEEGHLYAAERLGLEVTLLAAACRASTNEITGMAHTPS